MTEIIQFKAGKVEYDEETKQCTPERGTGLIKVAKNPEDPMLYSFIWEPRGNYKTVAGPDARDELLLFPGDAQWKHVKQCTTGRVFALTFKSSGQKLIFWMQNPTDGENPGDLSAEDKRLSESLQKLLEEPEEESEGQDQEDIELHDAPAEPTR
jgi:26S proteasome regulatory subunit N13